MRALDCECGKHLEARDDDELYGRSASTWPETTPRCG
jgi:hypothetical protein